MNEIVFLVEEDSEGGYMAQALGESIVTQAEDLDALRGLYQRRLAYVIPKLEAAGLIPACKTEAGFFTLWRVPDHVFGVELSKDPRTVGVSTHEAFNRLVISETGLVGVHFKGAGGEPLIRYAVCDDVLAPAFQSRFEAALARLKPEY